MAKILLVEDDNNLREIYGERLMAEGYDIVSASDGEEALQTAVTEKPDLIISDVMMPKISGFDMLDILRQTPETKDVKIIMMTALSQAEDKTRADKLGANKYLVKSQVTLEDVARVVHDLLGDTVGEDVPAETAASPVDTAPPAAPSVTPTLTPTVVSAPPALATPPAPDTSSAVQTPPPAVEPVIATPPAPTPVPEPVTTPIPTAPPVNAPAVPAVAPAPVTAATATVPAIPPAATPEPVATTPPVPTPPPAVEPVIATPPAPTPPATPPEPVAQPFNPISGAAPVTPEPNVQLQAAQAQDSQTELNEVAQQIEQFVATAPAETEHQEPIHEPTQQEIIHAQNASEDPKIVNAQPVSATIPPVVPINPSNPEPASSRKKIIQPVNGSSLSMPDIHALYEQEMAKEAAFSPVTNPESGSVVAAPVAEGNGPQNPITTTTAQEAPLPALETVDAAQITGVYATEEEAQAAAAPQQVTDASTAPVETSLPPVNIPPPAAPDTPPSNDPSDPNNIAL